MATRRSTYVLRRFSSDRRTKLSLLGCGCDVDVSDPIRERGSYVKGWPSDLNFLQRMLHDRMKQVKWYALMRWVPFERDKDV